MSKRKKNRISRKRNMEANGWNLKSEERDTIAHHTGTESLKHFHLKAEVTRQANNNKSSVWTEVSNKQGKVADVVLLRENLHPRALIVEIETDMTEEIAKEKRETFMGPLIQEVLVWQPEHFSSNLTEMERQVEEKLKGFL